MHTTCHAYNMSCMPTKTGPPCYNISSSGAGCRAPPRPDSPAAAPTQWRTSHTCLYCCARVSAAPGAGFHNPSLIHTQTYTAFARVYVCLCSTWFWMLCATLASSPCCCACSVACCAPLPLPHLLNSAPHAHLKARLPLPTQHSPLLQLPQHPQQKPLTTSPAMKALPSQLVTHT